MVKMMKSMMNNWEVKKRKMKIRKIMRMWGESIWIIGTEEKGTRTQ